VALFQDAADQAADGLAGFIRRLIASHLNCNSLSVRASLFRYLESGWIVMRYIGIWALAAVSIAVAAILFATQVGLPGGAANASGFTATFTAVEDTFIRDSNPGHNYGRHPKLQVDDSPSVKRTLMRFNVAGLPEGATVTSATLRLYVVNYSRSAGTVHTVEGPWSEAATTWSNAPAVGAKEAEFAGPAVVGNWVEADVTSAVTSNGEVNFYLVTDSADAAYYSSTEAAVNPPTLIVQVQTVDPPPSPTADPSPTPTSGPSPTPTDPSLQPEPPITAAFFYPWFPNAWKQGGIYPYTNFTPSLGFYDSSDDAIIDAHLALAERAHIEAFISSWWGQGHHTDTALATILSDPSTAASPTKWAIYYEEEGQTNPSAAFIANDLTYLNTAFFGDSSYLRVDGKPVVFVYGNIESAEMNTRWADAQSLAGLDVYISLKVYPGWRSSPDQPESWHQYGPSTPYHDFAPFSVDVSPGFWKIGETPRLERDPARFEADIVQMSQSGAFWQLITSFNEWGEGTSVEPAEEFGDLYIDILCRNLPGEADCDGESPEPTPAPTPTPTPAPSGSTFVPVADAFVEALRPDKNFGTRAAIRTDNQPVQQSYLRFNVQGASSSATLRIFSETTNLIGFDVRGVSDNTWGELSITYNNMPASGSVAASSGKVIGGNWYELDVSSLVHDGFVSFAISTTSLTGTRYSSREGTNPPELVLGDWSPLPTPTPTPTPTPSTLPGGSFSFSAAGDHGASSASTANLQAMAGDSSLAFHLALGDMSYADITPESAWCDYVKSIVGVGFPFQLITGNHEDEPGDSDGFIDNFASCLPDRLGSTGNYAHRYYFDYPAANPSARIIMADVDLRLSGSTQRYCHNETTNCNWLRSRIQEAKAQNLWVIVGMHKVCLSIGNKTGCPIDQEVVDMMIAEGVDLVLQSHDHDYQRSHSLSCAQADTFLSACVADDGADSLYAKGAGTVFVIQGTFGKGLTAINTSDSEFGYFAAWAGGDGTNTGVSRANGYVKYTVTDGSIVARFVPTSGGSYTDGFTIR